MFKENSITDPASPGIAAVIEDGSAWLFDMNPRLKHHESTLEKQIIELDQVPLQDFSTFQANLYIYIYATMRSHVRNALSD